MFNRTSRNGSVISPSDGAARSGRSNGALRHPEVPSIISANLQVEGTLRSAGDIQIDGRVLGDVISRSVTISQEAQVQGQVTCETARIDGYLSGEVRAKSVLISKSAHITGDVVHESLSIEAGAHIEGNLRRINGREAERLPAPNGEDWSDAADGLVELKDLEDKPEPKGK